MKLAVHCDAGLLWKCHHSYGGPPPAQDTAAVQLLQWLCTSHDNKRCQLLGLLSLLCRVLGAVPQETGQREPLLALLSTLAKSAEISASQMLKVTSMIMPLASSA